MKTPWKHLAEHPPCLVCLLARRRIKGKIVKAITPQEIAISSGLPLARIQVISRQLNWENVSVTEAERYVAGCNFDPLSCKDRNRKTAYNRSCRNTKKFAFLRKSPLWLSEYLPRINLLRSRGTS